MILKILRTGNFLPALFLLTDILKNQKLLPFSFWSWAIQDLIVCLLYSYWFQVSNANTNKFAPQLAFINHFVSWGYTLPHSRHQLNYKLKAAICNCNQVTWRGGKKKGIKSNVITSAFHWFLLCAKQNLVLIFKLKIFLLKSSIRRTTEKRQ